MFGMSEALLSGHGSNMLANIVQNMSTVRNYEA